MKKMVVPFDVKNIEDDSDFFTFKGYASTFGNVDEGGDKVIKGAFSEAIKAIKNDTGSIPILWQHKTGEPVGVFESFKEDDNGLFVHGRMPKDDSFVRDRVMPQMKIGSIRKLSIGYGVKKGGYKYDGNVRELNNLNLFETSLVTFPMNNEANITAVKALDFTELDIQDMRSIEDALISGVKFSNKTAKKIIHLMKEAGMLRDELDGNHDSELIKGLDEILKQIKE